MGARSPTPSDADTDADPSEIVLLPSFRNKGELLYKCAYFVM